MSVLALAEKYYPRLWNARRIETLVQVGRLTREEADRLMNKAE